MSAHKEHVRIHTTHTHTLQHTPPHWASDHYKAIPPRQKSLKQPLVFSGFMISPSVSSPLNSHQPLPLPKITQERHSSPRLTTAPLGRKRGIKTHTKKETHHIVEGGGKRAFIRPRAWRYVLMSLETKEPHAPRRQRPRQGEGKCAQSVNAW